MALGSVHKFNAEEFPGPITCGTSRHVVVRRKFNVGGDSRTTFYR